MSRLNASILLLSLCLAPSWAGATIINLTSSIDGAQANDGAGTGSAGTGSATLTFDDVSNVLSWSGSFSGLGTLFLVSHFHGPAAPGMGAPVAVGFSVNLDASRLSGTFMGAVALSAGQATELLAGLWYINIHSNMFPLGEIRGQVLVPEPGVALLLGGAMLGFLRARQR